jgi:hypothetical protein
MSELEPEHDPNQADDEYPPTPTLPSTMTSVSKAGVGNSD